MLESLAGDTSDAIFSDYGTVHIVGHCHYIALNNIMLVM